MPDLLLPDLTLARQYVLQGYCRQSVSAATPEALPEVLGWALEILARGDPLPPLGFVADLGRLVFGGPSSAARGALSVPGWPAALTRQYEDYVLGKLYSDTAFERAAAELARYRGRDRALGLAYLVNALRQRAEFSGAVFSPAVIKDLMQRPGDFLVEAWSTLDTAGPLPLLLELTEQLVQGVRNLGNVVAAEDVFELQHRTALLPLSDRLALRQVLMASAELDAGLPRQARRISSRPLPVPTRLLDDETYPVGGFSSISNRGSIESLLHTQLAYMGGERPDLFDLKFLRDELLYYSRDENEFHRRRRHFVFVLHPDLVAARVKDPDLPWQRVILVLGFLVTAVRRLTDWLGEESLSFRVVLGEEGGASPLAAERTLLEQALQDAIRAGHVYLTATAVADLDPLCRELARTGATQVVTFSSVRRPPVARDVPAISLQVEHRPLLEGNDGELEPAGELQEHSSLEAWRATTQVALLNLV